MKIKNFDMYLYCFFSFSHAHVSKEMLAQIDKFELDDQLKILIENFKAKKNNKTQIKNNIINYCTKVIKDVLGNTSEIQFELNELQTLAQISEYRLEQIFSLPYTHNLSLSEQEVLFYALNNYKKQVFNILRIKLDMKNQKSIKNKN